MRIPIFDQVLSLVRSKQPQTAPAAAGQRRAQPAREERLRAALAKIPIGVGIATADGHWLFINDRFRSLVGYTLAELARVTLHGVTHPDDAKQELPLMKKLVAGDIDHYRLEKRLMTRTGRYKSFDVATALSGDVLIFVVDEPKPAVTDYIPGVAIIRTDERGVVTGWNLGAEQIFGYARHEIVGKNRRVLYRDEDAWAGRSTSTLQNASEDRLEMDDWRIRKDGSKLWVHCAVTPFDIGGVKGYVETITPPAPAPPMDHLRVDLEKSRRTEESLREALDDLSRSSVETMNELRIMTAALRDEIDRRKKAEEEVRRVSARLAAVPPPAPSPEPEEISVDVPPALEWLEFGEITPHDLLRDCAFLQRTGTLLVSSDGREKEVFFDNGRLFSCASNDPGKFLAERLVAAGTITEEDRERAIEIKRASQLALGRILLILGAIDEKQLVDAMRSKLEDEVAELLTWAEGRYVFVEGEVPSLQLVPLRIEVETLLSLPQPVEEPVAEAPSVSLPEALAAEEDEPAAEAPASEPALVYIASRKSGKVHRPECKSAKRISGAARVELADTEGFELCRQCFR
jgi:PAS domain S-box-containing protein